MVLSSPAGGSSFLAPADISLAAAATANGHTISKVQFYNGTALLGEDTTAPYLLTWSNAPAGNYSLTARITYDGSVTLASGQHCGAETAAALGQHGRRHGGRHRERRCLQRRFHNQWIREFQFHF